MIQDQSYGVIPLKEEKGEWKVLLIFHKNGNHWGFPKGHKHGFESDFDAACRELNEETGMHVEKCLQEKPFTEKFQFRRMGEWVEKTVAYFPSKVKGEVKIQIEEIREASWFTFDDALKRLTFEEARSILKQVILMLSQQSKPS